MSNTPGSNKSQKSNKKTPTQGKESTNASPIRPPNADLLSENMSALSISSSLSIPFVFQSAITFDGQSNAATSFCLLPLRIMKQARIMPGQLIQVEFDVGCPKLLLRAWVNDKPVGGSNVSLDLLIINKIWQGNSEGLSDSSSTVTSSSSSKRQTPSCHIHPKPSARLLPCSSVTLLIAPEKYQELKQSSGFFVYVKELLGDSYVQRGHRCLIRYHSQTIPCEVITCLSTPTTTTTRTESVYYHITSLTTISIVKTTQPHIPTTSTHSPHTAPHSPPFPTLPWQIIREHFIGYDHEIEKLWSLLTYGLGYATLPNSPTLSLTSLISSTSVPSLPHHIFKPPKGILLTGPPGTGKTACLTALYSALPTNCHRIHLDHSLLLTEHPESLLRQHFTTAKTCSPCLLIVENIHLLLPDRASTSTHPVSEVQKRLVASWLNLVDALQPCDRVMILGTSSQRGGLDKAVCRAGRMDYECEWTVPNSDERGALLGLLVKKAGVVVVPSTTTGNSNSSSTSSGTGSDTGNSTTSNTGNSTTSNTGNNITSNTGTTGTTTGTATGSDTGMVRWYVEEEVLRMVAEEAHGMVGSDLLQVFKEASFYHITTHYHSSTSNNTTTIPTTIPTSDTGNTTTIPTSDTGNNSSTTSGSDTGTTTIPTNNTGNNIVTSGDTGNNSISDTGNTNGTSGTNTGTITGTASGITGSITGRVLCREAFRYALQRIAPSALREIVIEVPTIRWTQIGGMHRVKASIRQVLESPLFHPLSALPRQQQGGGVVSALAMTPLKGILLYGPPGCSKTLLAKAIATESAMNFLAVRGPELLSKWMGESEKAIQTLFRRARAAAPSIIFFDEIDALAGRRGDTSSGVQDRVLAQLLTELDGVQGQLPQQRVVVVAATNRPDMLDPALIRPGRIDRKIYVPPPDEASRAQIFQLELAKFPLEEGLQSQIQQMPVQIPVQDTGTTTTGKMEYSEFVRKSEGFSGAEVVGCCQDAVLLAIEQAREYITKHDILTAMEKIKPQITPEMLQFYESFHAKHAL